MKKLLVPTDPRHAMEAISVGAGSTFDCILVGVDPRYETVQMAFGVTANKTTLVGSSRQIFIEDFTLNVELA